MLNFETVYRKTAGLKGKARYLDFAQRMAVMMNRDWTRAGQGACNWVWAQNELQHQGKQTVRQVCFGHYYTYAPLFKEKTQ